jgi:hypothetical protein
MRAMPLPDPGSLRLDPRTAVAGPVPAEGLVLYRLLAAERPEPSDFEQRRTRLQAARDGIPDLFRLSVSFWLTLEEAAGRSSRAHSRIAEIRLELEGRAHARSARLPAAHACRV